jgi:hypothetical protein
MLLPHFLRFSTLNLLAGRGAGKLKLVIPAKAGISGEQRETPDFGMTVS